MGYFDAIGTEGALQDIQRLRSIFTSQYHPFLDKLDAAVYPTKENRGGNAQQRWNPNVAFSKNDLAKWNESQYISHPIEQMLQSFQFRMMRTDLKIDVASIPRDTAEGVRQGIVEDFCNGVRQVLNIQEADAVSAQNHMARMAMFAGRYGKICQFIDVIKDDDGWKFVWDFYHPRCVLHDFGQLPRVFVYEAYFSRPQIEVKLANAYGEGNYRMPDKTSKRGNGELIRLSELWVEEYVGRKTHISNQCFVEDEAASEPTVYAYTRRPFQVIAMTGQGAAFQAITQSPKGDGDASTPFQSLGDHARPFWASLIDNVRIYDDAMSMELQAMALAINPPRDITELTPGAASGIERQPIGPGTTLIHNQDVTVKSMELLSKNLENFTTPKELKDERLRIWPSALWGAVASANESNILYTNRIDEGENAIVGPALLVATAYQRGFETILHESRAKGVEISMAVTATKGAAQGQEHMVNFVAKRDIPESFGLKITVPPMLPRDDMKTVQTYQLAVTSGMSDELLAMRDIAKHPDPQAVIERRTKDRVRNSQAAMDEAVLDAMFEKAEELSQEAEREEDQAERIRLRRSALRMKLHAQATEAKLMGQAPGFQMAPEPSTPAPAQQPPEERGFESPPLQRQMAGQPNPGGRPPMPGGGA